MKVSVPCDEVSVLQQAMIANTTAFQLKTVSQKSLTISVRMSNATTFHKQLQQRDFIAAGRRRSEMIDRSRQADHGFVE
jgi:hypothetical protein